jgi:hypothetical protein
MIISLIFFLAFFQSFNKWLYLWLFYALALGISPNFYQGELAKQIVHSCFYIVFFVLVLNINCVLLPLNTSIYSDYLLDPHEFNFEYFSIILWIFIALNFQYIIFKTHLCIIILLHILAASIIILLNQGLHIANYLFIYLSIIIMFFVKRKVLQDFFQK